MKVVEIFKSIDGEGITAGYPAVFVRLFGCNLRCSYCDSLYACIESQATGIRDMSIQEIYDEVWKMGCNRVTITGGEPLLDPAAIDLIEKFASHKFMVNVETNGSIPILGLKHKNWSDNVIITLDYKCPSSGMESKMNLTNITSLQWKDVLKFVVGSKEDLDVCRRIYPRTAAHVFISPVFGKIEPKEIVEYMLEHDMQDCRLQIQMHKIIYDPDARGV